MTASTIESISEGLTCLDVLDALRIDHRGVNQNIKCPVHSGTKKSFSVFDGGRRWKCFSHDCGHPHRRDAINLFCLLKFGAPLPRLSNADKAQAIREAAQLAGVTLPEMNSPDAPRIEHNFFKRRMSVVERDVVGKFLAGEISLNDFALMAHGSTPLFESRLTDKILLFAGCAKSEDALPATPGGDARFMSQLLKFLRS